MRALPWGHRCSEARRAEPSAEQACSDQLERAVPLQSHDKYQVIFRIYRIFRRSWLIPVRFYVNENQPAGCGKWVAEKRGGPQPRSRPGTNHVAVTRQSMGR